MTTADNDTITNITNDNTNVCIIELKLQRILNANEVPTFGTTNFRKWFLQQFNNDDECTLEKFAVYFFNTVRHQASIHLRPSETIEENFDEKRIARELQLNLFPELGKPTQVTMRNVSSTPTRKTNSPKHMQTPSPNTRRSIENANSRNIGTGKNNSLDKSRNSTGDTSIGFCLGDFLTSPTVNNRHNNSQKKKIPPNTTSTPNNNHNHNNNNTRPRKRVVPISIGKTSTTIGAASGSPNNCAFGSNSSFSQENNIQQLSNTDGEMKDFNQHSVSEARKALKNDICEVSSVIKAASAVADLTQSVQKLHIKSTQIESDEKLTRSIRKALEEIPKKTESQLKMLASIYGLLLDMNLTINILQEISLLLNLLNANVPITGIDVQEMNKPTKIIENVNENILNSLLKEISNCIFFAICVLEDQQHTLALIDTKSLGVVLQSERLVCLTPSLSSSLNSVYAQKQALSNSSQYNSSISNSGFLMKNVCFQEDTDSRQFFYNNNEFGAFKTQRDIFYSTLKHWEKHHLYPKWKFTLELTPKVREIFSQSENPINMIHFAKLFVSQLLISANEQHTAPEEFGIGIMDDIDLKKFTKLSQRLVAPSNFSVDYQFPREQAFFRDFIIESRSMAFIEHLKMILFSELLTLNDSQFEELNSMTNTNTNNIEINDEENEFIVRPDILSSMLILAKFLGFVLALPFQGGGGGCGGGVSTIIQNEQLTMRRLFHPAVNICQILETSIQNGRHLITIPWLVQYLAMLDDVTLQLYSHVETINKLYELYQALGNSKLQITPTSAFIVRCCLGWLFEQKPSIGIEYINYRITVNSIKKTNAIEEVKKKTKSKNTRIKKENSIIKFAAAKADLQLKPILDTILSVACPFLAEFRVSIMPTKHAQMKNVSRSGRFRHITPCIAETSTTTTNQQIINSNVLPSSDKTESANNTNNSVQRQKLLMESFLHSQNSSIRRLIVFISERVYKCVVKDAQLQILLPSKEIADNEINKITKSIDKQYVLEQVKIIYQNASKEANKKWNENVPIMINDRINRSLDALLSIETTTILKKAYAWRIKCDASMKIEQWRHMNLNKQDFYCNDLNELATKICKANANANANHLKKSNYQTTELILVQSKLPRISDLIEEMQHWLYTTGFQTSFQPEIFAGCNDHQRRDVALIAFIERLKSSFVNTLPTIYYRLIGAGLIQILQHMIALNPSYISANLIEACCKFFLDSRICIADAASTTIKECKTFKANDLTMECGDLDPNTLKISNSPQVTTTTTTTTIYQSLITAPFLQSLGTCALSYEKLKALLHALIQAGVVTMGFVNDLFMIAFKEDLDVNVLNAISKMLYELSKEAADDNNYDDVTNLDEDAADCDSELKSHLLMEVLADFSRNLNDF